MSEANYEARGSVAVITMDNPPVNGLGSALRTGVVDGLRKAVADPSIKSIVLTGAGRAFSGGADIREFNSPKALAEPTLFTMIRVIEDLPKPVVAAVHAICMGGGLELALGCHYRVAAADTQVALPEVKLGLIPGAGGTQRLPRVVPLDVAVNVIVSGNPIKAAKFKGTRLFDEIVDGDVVAAAVALAEKVGVEGKRPRVRDLPLPAEDAQGFLQFSLNTVKTVARDYPAPAKAIEAIQAGYRLPFDQAVINERQIFLSLMQTPESKSLRHAFFAERSASKIPDVPEDTPARPIRSAAVIGAGTMGGGIAMNFANAGIPVTVLEAKKEALDKGLATIRKNYESSAKKGRMSAEDAEKRIGLITPTMDYAAIGQADIVVEAVFEDMGVKETVFRKLDEVMKPGAILASNTSTLDVDRIASFTKRPGDVIGTHFFSPANVMKLLEIVRGAKTAPDVLSTTMKLSKTLKKTGVIAGVCDGFIGNRMIEQYSRQAGFMLDEGATPAQVDKAVEKFGFAMGPFRMGDLAGNDIGWYIRKRRAVERPSMNYSKTADLLCEMGRFGQKTGAGWYRYETGRRDAIPDPVVDEMIASYRQQIGIKPRKLSDDEIVHRLVFSLVNEGARLLEEGIATRASDIDMVYLTGYGFPLHRGGPMFYADQYGLYNVIGRMAEFAVNPHGDSGFWTPAPLLARLAAEGKGFNG